MNYLKNPAIIILIGGAIIAGMIVYRNQTAQSPPATRGATGSGSVTNQNQQEAQIDDQANVSVIITPTDVNAKSSEWKFDVSMNTHSVELDQDLTQVAVLVDNNSKEYKPLRWEGPVGGHHREGTLTFAPVTPYPSRIMLKISEIAGVERSFVWILDR